MHIRFPQAALTGELAIDDKKDSEASGLTRDQGSPKSGVRIVDSKELLAGQREVWIRHKDEMYRLRITSAGRLYLSK